MQRKPSVWDRTLWALSVVASVVCVNIVGMAYFGRLDMTRDKQFTLSAATRRALAALPAPVTVRAYFTADLPPPYGTHARYVRDMLEAYFAEGHGKLRFEFVDPGKQISHEHEAPADDVVRDIFGRMQRPPTAMERELEATGIVPVQVRVNEADKVEVKRAFMGLALELGDKKEVIPVVTDTQGLEYDLTTLLRKLGKQQPQRLGILRGHADMAPGEGMGQAMAALSQIYAVSEVSLADPQAEPSPLADLDVLWVVGPQTALAQHELDAIRTFIAEGHPVGLFAGPVQSDLQHLTTADNAAGLEPLLQDLGVEMLPGLVLDAACATLNVQQQAGFMRVAQPVSYPFIGETAQLEGSNVTAGLEKVLLPFMGPLRLQSDKNPQVHAEVWLRSSDKSWVQQPPYDLNPMQRWSPDRSALAPQPLLVALRGPLLRSAATPTAADVPEGRVLVAAGHDFLRDAYLQKSNEALVLNMADWLMRDDDLLAVRTRGLSAAPLQPVAASRRQGIKLGNVVGVPLAFVALGLMRWRRRERRRASVVFALSPAAPQGA
jgi:ABC-type uncharacterized transport system involved in gliding motility auxiliary subunit